MGLIHASVNYVSGKVADLLLRIEALVSRIDENTLRLTSKADLVNGKVPADQLPGYVDDVIECADAEAFPLTGESGKLYLALDTNKVYRWSGTQYIQVSGEEITFDDALSADSVNAIQNQWLGKRLGATSANSVQIGYNAKAGKTPGQAVDGSDGDNGCQVAVGNRANGAEFGTAMGGRTWGSQQGVAVGYSAIGYSGGVAVGYGAVGYNGAVAVGHSASANSATPIVIGGSQFASAQITVSNDGVLKVGGKVVALTSDIPDTSGFVKNSGTESDPAIKGGGSVTIQSTGVSYLTATFAGRASGIAVNPAQFLVVNQGDITGFAYANLIAGINGGLVANNGCCFTPVANVDDDLAFTIRRNKTVYATYISGDALETTLSVRDTNSVIASGEVCVIWLHIKVASIITTAPQITVPDTIQFLDNGPSFAVGSECMLALMSTDGGATWLANVQWEVE